MDHLHLSAPESAQINMAEPLYGAAAIAVRDQLREPTDLQVAVHVAQQLLDSDSALALREALRLLLRAVGAETSDPRTVRHANGLEFRVIPADSYDARMARDVRQLTMADGRVWTVGQPVGWYGTPAAWRTTTAEAAGR